MDGIGKIWELSSINYVLSQESKAAQSAMDNEEQALLDLNSSEEDDDVVIVDDDAAAEVENKKKNHFSTFEGIRARKKQMDAMIAQNEREIKELTDSKEAVEEEQKANSKKIKAENNNLEEVQYTTERKVDEIESQTQKLENIVEDNQNMFKTAQSKEVEEAKTEYNQAEDGDFQAFLNARLDGMDVSLTDTTSVEGEIKDLSGDVDELKYEAKTGVQNLEGLQAEKTTIDNEIIEINEDMGELNVSYGDNQIEQLKANDAYAVISKLTGIEMEFLEGLDIDLTEKLPDGSNRYFFAKGKNIGTEAYSIYDRANGCASIVRSELGYSIESYNIIESGNGYIRNMTTGQTTSTIGLMSNQKTGTGDDGETVDDSVEDAATTTTDATDGEETTTTGETTDTDETSTDEEEDLDETIYELTENGVSSSSASYTSSSPLSFDVDGDGVNTAKKMINYDIDGDGIIDKIHDFADWVLAFDKDGDGVAGEDGSETFGNNTDLNGDGKKDGFSDGFAALRQLAQQEGLIGENDTKLDAKDLKILSEKYGLTMKQGYLGETKSFADLGITEINISDSETRMEQNYDGKGNHLMTQEGATFKVNGQTREYADIWHRKQDDIKDAFSSSALSFNIEANVNHAGKWSATFDNQNSKSARAINESDVDTEIKNDSEEVAANTRANPAKEDPNGDDKKLKDKK